jgi:hypothetical protein
MNHTHWLNFHLNTVDLLTMLIKSKKKNKKWKTYFYDIKSVNKKNKKNVKIESKFQRN